MGESEERGQGIHSLGCFLPGWRIGKMLCYGRPQFLLGGRLLQLSFHLSLYD